MTHVFTLNCTNTLRLEKQCQTQHEEPTLWVFIFFRMHGSALSAGSTTHLYRGTVFDAGPCAKTGTKISPDLPIPFLFLTSRRAVPSPPTMRTTTAMLALTSQTAAGRCLTLSSFPLTPMQIGRCPPCQQGGVRGLGPQPSSRLICIQELRVRKTWAWR